MATLNLQVSASTDDASEHSSGGITRTWGRLPFGQYVYDHSGMRFTGVSGLAGATIDDATLEFYSLATSSGSFVANWYAELLEAPPTFTLASSNITGRTRTTAVVAANSEHFGPWAGAGTHTFTTDGTNTIADLIQELVDAPNNFDPSEIVILCIYVSGSGERVSASCDSSYAAPKLDIDYSTGGAQEVTPDPATFAAEVPTPTILVDQSISPTPTIASLDVLNPTVTLGGLTITPTAVAAACVVPTATVSLTLTVEPTAATAALAVPTPSVVVSIVVSPDPVIIGTNVLAPLITLGIPVYPDPATAALNVPTPTITLGGITVTPDPVTIAGEVPSPTVVVGLITITPTATTASLFVPAPTIVLGTLTVAPDPVTASLFIPSPTVTGVATFAQFGVITRWIDPDDYSSTALFYFEAVLKTSAAANAAKARLYNQADEAQVNDSEVTSISTTGERVRSASLSLPSGGKEYRAEFGGAAGGEFTCYTADVVVESG